MPLLSSRVVEYRFGYPLVERRKANGVQGVGLVWYTARLVVISAYVQNPLDLAKLSICVMAAACSALWATVQLESGILTRFIPYKLEGIPSWPSLAGSGASHDIQRIW